MRRATPGRAPLSRVIGISIHALLAESDPCRTKHSANSKDYFYPRSPCGERRTFTAFCVDYPKFLSTLSLRRATRNGSTYGDGQNISIHALLAESDGLIFFQVCTVAHFYPRSPCGERQCKLLEQLSDPAFLSTLSLRRATGSNQTVISQANNFYPRSPCGERQAANGLPHAPPEISIHALLAESDAPWLAWLASCSYFYPRSPCGERRRNC